MSLTYSTPLEAAQAAKTASHVLATLSAADRNAALSLMASQLEASRETVLAANAEDMRLAREAQSSGSLSASLVSRLDLSKPGKYEEMVKGVRDVASLPDPLGKVDLRTKLDNGLVLERVSTPIGVVLVIFEARPEVVANIAALAVKSGNAAILKGGKESLHSFTALANAISAALSSAESKVPAAAVQLVATRDAIPPLLALDNLVDLVIPRGGNELVRYVKSATKIPVLGHADGLCIGYLERTAPRDLAVRVLLDAKTGYPAACNSLETLLVDQALLDPAQGSGGLWPTVAEALVQAGVELRCDAATKAALPAALLESPKVVDVQPADYDTEHLALVLTVAAVPTADAAIAHINTHGSHHTDVILTSDEALAERFLSAVDSAGVYWNASTRLADGFRYGFGTEVGISTNKIHARGPVGLEGLTIYKYKLRGKGQTAGEFGLGEGKRAFLHEKLPLD